MTTLTRDIAEKFAALALAHVGREYPNKLDHVIGGPGDLRSPRALHPIFFGSFDWHSCVHGYWLLARLLRRYPDLSCATAIDALYAERVTRDNVAAECAYLERLEARGFERPYGWSWLLALQAELGTHKHAACASAAATLRPLAEAFALRFKAFLPLCDYPIRAGVHSSTAFALRMAADYAAYADLPLFDLMRAKALAWYGADRDAQVWEPSQDDFLSPTLMQAECMRRFMAPETFAAWFAAFLPHANEGEPATLFAPARVSDRADGKIAHLDGLNFSRAWCWRAIASALPDHPLASRARETAARHIEASLPHVAGDYEGEHWLASFALLALEP
jgi:class 3 adenylate cyclase